MSTSVNSDRDGGEGMASQATMLRRRLVWTVVLVLAALGGAGLATAADRAPTDDQRPELTWRAEHRAAPVLAEMRSALGSLATELDALAESGRAVLAGLPALDATSVTEAIERGDAAIVAVGQGVTALTAVRDEQRALVADDRLSQATRTGLVATDAALAAAAGLPDAWAGVSARAGLMTALLSSLAEHDRLVLAATDAGRDARWQSALDLLASAEAQLEVARGLSGSLAADGHVATLDELLDRYSDFDAALVALYAEIDRTGTDQAPEIDALRGAVDRTRAALPQTTGALSVAVSEAAGDRIALAVVDIEQARGVLAAARRALGDE